MRSARVFGGALTAAVLLAVVLAACWLLYQREARQIAERQSDLETVRVNLLAQMLRSDLRPVTGDLRLLADGDAFRAYLDTGQPSALQNATHRAAFISTNKPLYGQIRYIDQAGQEVIRINHGGDVVTGPQLQNRAARPYFQTANSLPQGALFVSAFELNLEVAQPTATLRFGIPVFNSAGERRGIYLINCRGDELIDSLRQAATTVFKRVRLLNDQGYWLVGSDPGEEWGFMFPDRQGFTLARSDPALWDRMRRDPAGQSPYGGGLITWHHVEAAEFIGLPAQQLKADGAFLVVASAITASEWNGLFAGMREIMWIAAVGLAVLTLVCVWLFRGRLDAIRNLRTMNEDLESRVRARTDELARSYELVQHREQLLEQTGTMAKIGGWDVDPIAGTGNWTPEVARIHDLDPSVISNSQLRMQSYPGESRTKLQAAIKAALEHGTPYDLDLEFQSARGVRKWVRTICQPIMRDGKVVLMRGALQDITERKEAEFRLRAQLQRLHLLEQITRAIGERQDLGSVLQIVVRTLEEELPLDFVCLCLYAPTDRMLTVVALGVASSVVADQLTMNEQARIPIDENGLSRCVSGHLVYEPELDGIPFPFPQRLARGGLRSLVIAPLQVESQVFGVLVSARRQPNSFSSGECEFLRQLSEHVALAAHQAQLHTALQTAYEELRNTQQAVMQQERLRVLGQMASGIAHDINNAISPITLYADTMLESEPSLSERGRAYLNTIQQAASDVAETVARLREFYRQDVHPNLVPLNLNEILPQVVDLTRARWEAIPQQRGIVIDMRVDLDADLPAILGMKSELREALTNLVFNAVDAMPNGGTLTLRSRKDDHDRVRLEIIDTGVGMDDDTRRRCLEPFFTTKGERGTGLGLAMVYGVIQRHDGDLEINSSPGIGTTVRMSFNGAPGASLEATETYAAIPSGLNILLVDDDPILLRSLRETLELDGHTVLSASSGKQGIEIFKQSMRANGQSKVSAVITDLGMPYCDGRSVAQAVKLASPHTPVILLTGWGERLLAEGDAQPNIDRILSKPPRLREVRKALAELTAHQADLR